MDETVATRAQRIRLVLFDVDGVLTDGRVTLNADGTESQQFHIRDGAGIVVAERCGLMTGILSGRATPAAAVRARQLRMSVIEQGAADKLEVYERIRRAHGLADGDVAFMGDDLLDLGVLSRVGLAAAPSDAAAEVRGVAHWISHAAGGAGAARELLELVLQAQRRWQGAIEAIRSRGGRS